MERKKDLIEKVLDVELDMFLAVNSVEPTSCKENPNAFRFIRGSGFGTWSYDTLASYIGDLNKAKQEGKNLMTQKYARMGNQVGCLNFNPIIDKIVDIENKSLQRFKEKYPHLLGSVEQGETDRAGVYLRSELETYSDKTLNLYYANLLRAKEEKRNLEEEIYSDIFKKLGYSSLQEAEEKRKVEGCKK